MALSTSERREPASDALARAFGGNDLRQGIPSRAGHADPGDPGILPERRPRQDVATPQVLGKPALDCGGGSARCHNTGLYMSLFRRKLLLLLRLGQTGCRRASAPPGKRWPKVAACGQDSPIPSRLVAAKNRGILRQTDGTAS